MMSAAPRYSAQSLAGHAPAAVTPREHRRGILLMVGATLCWSIAGLLTRNSSIANGWEVTFWRSFYTAAFLAAVLLVSHGRGAIAQIRAVGVHGAISGALFAVMFTCFMLALTRTSTANTLVLTSTSPFYAALLGWLFLHERIPLRTWVAMPCAFAGIYLMFADSVETGGFAGNLIALLVPLAFGVNIVVIRRTGHHIDLLPTVMLGGLISAVVTLPFALPFTANSFDHLLMLGLGVVQLGIGCVLMTRAARYLRATEIGLLSLLETILGPLWTWIGVGETPANMTLIGGGIVIGALLANELAGLWLDRKPVTVP
jgi:drug/metabolite transporter (DMT)-like permease